MHPVGNTSCPSLRFLPCLLFKFFCRGSYPMSTRAKLRVLTATGAVVMVFGLLCLNYTKIGNVERHTAVAAEHGWPPPSSPIAYLGMVVTPIGAGLIGYAVGARSS